MALKDQLTQAAQSIGPIETEPGREGGDDRFHTATGVYAEKVGTNRYRVPILGNVDSDGTPGRGAFMVEVDGTGKVLRQPYYQNTTNHDWSGLAAFIMTAAGGMIASAYAGPAAAGANAGALTAEELANFGLAGGVTPANVATMTIPQATAASIAAATGIPEALLTAPGALATLAKIAPSVFNTVKSFLPQGVQNVLSNILGGGTGMFDLAAGALQADQLVGASNTAANAYNELGDQAFNDYLQHATNLDNRTQGIGNTLDTRYNALGAKTAGMLGDLATQAKGDYNALGTAASETYNGIASGTKTAYDNLLNKVEGTTEKFTPWNVTTNVGSTNKGLFTPTVGTQNVSDQATAAAGSSFGAANNIDVNNLAQQKFGQQKAMLAPYDAQELAKLRANLQATGRTGAASNATGQAISPELAAYYLSKGTRDAGLLTNADQAALNVRGGLINQGSAASGVPLNIAQAGVQQIGAGVNAGATQANTNNNLGQMLGSLGSRGIDAVTQAQLHGADQTLPIFQNAVSVPLGLQRSGIDTMLSQGNKGLDALTGQLNLGTNAINSLGQNAIDAKYGMYLRSIKQRYDGNLQKATLLAKVLSSLGGMTAQSQQAAASGDTSALAAQLLKMGLTSSDIDRIISDAYSGSSAATTFLEENGGPSIWGPL